MILSDGVLVKSPTTVWEGTTATFPGWNQILTGQYWSSYADIYRQQVWVSTVVNKLAMGTARLPLKVYERDELNRPQVPDHPYAKLLNNPNPKMSRFAFWLWVSSTFDIYGEAFILKIRDRGGRPVQLVPLHPSCMHIDEEDNGEAVWLFRNGKVEIKGIRQSDLVHPRTYNPESTRRGLSRLEPLRRTLEFEDAAQRSQSSFWRNGARPGFALKHPGNLSQPAADRVKVRFDEIARGADKTGTTIVLEEGMEPMVLSVSNEDAQYVDSRKLNREEVCGAYDIPPPAVHILDRATFSNITEQMRSLYRDTHAPRLQLFEGCLETELRASVQPGKSEPDFSDDVYAEFLLDEVLRGDFEARSAAYSAADYMTVAEKRKSENLPFIEGTDRILVNAAVIPLDEVDNGPAMQNIRSVLGRVSRIKTIGQIRPDDLVAGLNDHTAALVRDALAAALTSDDTVPQFRDRLKALGGPR
jgi:HK97 family phage portal protein